MSEWQNLQVAIEMQKLNGIPTTEPDATRFAEDVGTVIVKALHEYFSANSSLSLEHFAEFAKVNVEVQPFEEAQHVIEIKGEYDWTLQHPLSERPNLISCSYNTALKATGGKGPGRYYCTLEIFGEASDGSGKPRAIPPTPVVVLGERIETDSKEE